MAENTRIHGPASEAPSVTNLVAHCRVCGIQWQVKSDNRDDIKGCSFCDAGDSAIYTTREDEG